MVRYEVKKLAPTEVETSNSCQLPFCTQLGIPPPNREANFHNWEKTDN